MARRQARRNSNRQGNSPCRILQCTPGGTAPLHQVPDTPRTWVGGRGDDQIDARPGHVHSPTTQGKSAQGVRGEARRGGCAGCPLKYRVAINAGAGRKVWTWRATTQGRSTRAIGGEGAHDVHRSNDRGVSKLDLMRVILRQPRPEHVPRELRLSPGSRLVLLAIIDHCDHEEVVTRCRISKRALARATGIDRSIVFSRHVPELVEAGYVVREPSTEDGFGGFSLVLSTFNRLHAINQSRADSA